LTCTVSETTITGEVVGNVADFTFVWTTANGNIVSGANTLTPTVSKAGTYTMSAVNTLTGCQATLNVDVNEINNTPVAQYGTALANGQLTLTSTAAAPGTTTWDLGNNQTATGSSVTITFPTSGTYTICMTLTNECGTNTSCNDVVYFTAFAVNGTVSDAKCAGDNGAIVTSVSGGPITGAVSYAWTGPNGFTSNEASISNVPAGVYTCVITDAAGLTATQIFTITEPSAIAATATTTLQVVQVCFLSLGQTVQQEIQSLTWLQAHTLQL
jgi:PKD domain